MTRTGDSAHRPPVPAVSAAIFACLALALLLTGSIADYPIAQGLYTPDNAFGVLLAAYGEAPALLALVAAGTLAIGARPPVHPALRWLLLIGGAGLILVGTIALIIRPEEYWPLPLAVRTLIALALSIGVIWAVSRVAEGANWQAMCVLAGALFAVVAVEMVLVQGLKIVWERPRMRMLEETGAPFAPWWSPGYAEREALIGAGTESSEFKSFPSGHAANASVLMMLVGFGLLRDDLRRRATALFWVGGIWALLVALSRISLGAHFLTDTAVGMLVTLATVVAVAAISAKVLDAHLLDRLPTGSPEPPPRHGRDPNPKET